jgi:DNA processing protein
LAEEIIAKGGAVISEYPPGVHPSPIRFPKRNRIIAGLTKGSIIVEAAEKSGALITAECALDYNRDVWAVPGPITNGLSTGTNKLLTHGAHPAVSAEYILSYYGLAETTASKIPKEDTRQDPIERKILLILDKEPTSINILIEQSEVSTREIMSALTALEISGRITRYGDLYQLKR